MIRLTLRKDIVIPKGTVFDSIDGSRSEFYYDNYDASLELDKDTSARIIVSSENKDYFRKEEVYKNSIRHQDV